jgi:D-alanyl-lipoteichoic acid acyltransferase DltB (MBOAT superfamily)
MLFNSFEFIIFFLIFFFSYWFIFNKNIKLQNLLILCSSYFFYAWWDWRFLILIIVSSFTDYLIGIQIENLKDKIYKKRALILSLFVNLGILLVFKYYNFFIDNFKIVLEKMNLQTNPDLINIILPIGISFYTFQTLSYTIDVYNNKISAHRDIISFFAFVAFFPQLVAGPIERAKNLLPQFLIKRKFNYDFAISGCKLILIGLFKKMVIADNISLIVDPIYSNPNDFLGFPTLLATIFFAFQIYCDFSGYSDIAIGLARLLGFKLMTNFNTPYFSKSLTDFWRNWHISLSTWFKDYVYIPLGGNRISKKKMHLNILITFLLSGFWHGANWTFLVWGAIHGFGLIIEKNFPFRLKNNFVSDSLRIFSTFSIVCLAWIFFRSETFSDSILIFNNLFVDILDYTNYNIMSLKFRGIGLKPIDLIKCVLFVILLIFIELSSKSKKIMNIFNSNKFIRYGGYYFILILIIFWGTRFSGNNFIYFQF